MNNDHQGHEDARFGETERSPWLKGFPARLCPSYLVVAAVNKRRRFGRYRRMKHLQWSVFASGKMESGTTSTFVPRSECALLRSGRFIHGHKKEYEEDAAKPILMTTMRDVPSEAEALSHQWMLRGGYIRQTARGIYSYRRWDGGSAKDRSYYSAGNGCLRGRRCSSLFSPPSCGRNRQVRCLRFELIRSHDRHNREFVLGPTHEEVITSIVRQEISSYRKSPVNLYQIQNKYRDERRPRFGRGA